ncbi:MAG: hypothetical protein H7Z10_13070 [Gemmatimonadaceae bacterium]|nr:hypothetical protein [Acetobacteraceae bacterium]
MDGATWDWHRGRGDYSQWLQECVKDPELADEVRTIEAAAIDGAEARQQIRAAVERKYTAPG